MQTTTKTLTALSAFALLAGTSNAAPVTILNHSFEDATNTSWRTATNGSTSIVRTFGVIASSRHDTPPDGSDTINHSNGSHHLAYQVLGATLAANTTYTLTVDIGDRTDHGPGAPVLRLGTVSATPTANDDYGLNLLTGTIVENDVPVNGAGASDGWETWVSTFTTGASPTGLGDALRVELHNDGGVQALYDNVHLDASTVIIPEPATGAMALVGLGAMAMRRRRG